MLDNLSGPLSLVAEMWVTDGAGNVATCTIVWICTVVWRERVNVSPWSLKYLTVKQQRKQQTESTETGFAAPTHQHEPHTRSAVVKVSYPRSVPRMFLFHKHTKSHLQEQTRARPNFRSILPLRTVQWAAAHLKNSLSAHTHCGISPHILC